MDTQITFDFRLPPSGYLIVNSGYKRLPEIIYPPDLGYPLLAFVSTDRDYPKGPNVAKVLEIYSGESPRRVRVTSVDPDDRECVERIMREKGYIGKIEWMADHRDKYTKRHIGVSAETVYDEVIRFIDGHNRLPTPSDIKIRGIGRQTTEEALETLVNEGMLHRVPVNGKDSGYAYGIVENVRELMET